MFADPRSNLMQFDLKHGQHVADLGAGFGFYSLEAARLVGPSGRVFAIEVQKDLLDRLKNTASHEGLHNVEVVWGDIETVGGTRLRDASVDRVIISNTLFQVEARPHCIAEVVRILKSGGKLLLIDWSDDSSVSGPKAVQLISKSDARALSEQGGLVFEKEITAGAHHYGLIFKKS